MTTQTTPNKMAKYKESMIYSGGGQLVEQLLRVVTVFFMIRLLERDLYGVYVLFLGTARLIGTFISWGWTSVYTRYLPELKEQGNVQLITSLVVRGIVTRATLATLSVVFILLFFEQVGGFFNIAEYHEYFTIFSAGIFLTIMVNIFQSIINAHFNHKETYIYNVAITFIKNIVFIIILGLGSKLKGLFIVETIAMLILFLVYGQFIWTKIISFQSFTTLSPIPQNIRSYNLYSFLNDTGSFFLGTSIDTFIIAKYLGIDFVAIYNVALVLPQRIGQFMPTTILRNVLEPMFFENYAKNKTDANLNRNFHLLTKINFFILIPTFFVFVFFGKDIILFLFGEQYIEVFAYLIGLSLFFFLEKFPIGYVTKATENVHINAISKIFSLYNLVLGIILIQRIGLMGMVIATGSAQLFKAIYVYWHTKKLINIDFPTEGFIKLITISILYLGSIYLIMWGFNFSLNIIILLLGLSALPFYLSLIRLNYYSLEELKFLQRLTQSLIGKSKWTNYILGISIIS